MPLWLSSLQLWRPNFFLQGTFLLLTFSGLSRSPLPSILVHLNFIFHIYNCLCACTSMHRFHGSSFCLSTSRPADFQIFKSWNCYSFWIFTIYPTSWFSWPYRKPKVEKKLFKMDYFAEVLFSVQTHYLKKINRLSLSCFLTAKGKL